MPAPASLCARLAHMRTMQVRGPHIVGALLFPLVGAIFGVLWIRESGNLDGGTKLADLGYGVLAYSIAAAIQLLTYWRGATDRIQFRTDFGIASGTAVFLGVGLITGLDVRLVLLVLGIVPAALALKRGW